MAPVRKSKVWVFFKKSADNKFATCTVCNQQLKYFVSTGNLKQHIRRKHHTQYNLELQKEKLLSTKTEAANLPLTESENEVITFSVPEAVSIKSQAEDVPRAGFDNIAEVIFEESRGSDDEIEKLHATDSHGSNQSLSCSTSRNMLTASRKKKRDCYDDALRSIAESLQSKTKMSNKAGGTHGSFGTYVAQELDDMPQHMAVYCKKIINEAIYHAQLGNLTQHSKVINEDHNLSYR